MALRSVIDGKWETEINDFRDLGRYKQQGGGMFRGTVRDYMEPGSIFTVTVKVYIKRRVDENISREDSDRMRDDPSYGKRWIEENTESVGLVNLTQRHPLIYFHCYLVGNTPSRNLSNRYEPQVEILEPSKVTGLFRIGDTNFQDRIRLFTIYDVIKWVESKISSIYNDFDDGGDHGEDDTDIGPDPGWQPDSSISDPNLAGV